MNQQLKTVGSFFWEVVKVALISLAIIVPIRFFLVQPFYVKGQSMEPNFHDKDYLLIDEISYRFRAPSEGEAVVFRYPRNPTEFFIKRIIGLPGDHVVIRDGHVWVGKPGGDVRQLAEPYLKPSVLTRGEYDVTVGAHEYFVLGDNREASLDSRSFGAVDARAVVGRIWVRGWPFDRWTVYPATGAFIPAN